MNYTKYNIEYALSDFSTADEAAQVIADVIMAEYENVLIERCVKSRYGFLLPDEQKSVAENAKSLAAGIGCEDFPSHSERRRKIYNGILHCFEECSKIIPCGFVDFRFREEYFYIEAICARGADMFFDRKEYEEFTYLLSLFVSEKESREQTVHMLWTKDGVKLLNKRRRDITKKYEKEFSRVAESKGIGGDDIAISSLIAAAPERIVMHMPPDTPLSQTVSEIFKDKCHICRGCNICKNS